VRRLTLSALREGLDSAFALKHPGLYPSPSLRPLCLCGPLR